MKAHGKSSQNFFAGLILVSDGSIKINNMTNRWVMAKKIGGEILVSGLAAKYGKCNSLQANGYGILAAILFVALIGVHTNNTNIICHRYSGNKELINQCCAHSNYYHPFPNETTISEQHDKVDLPLIN